jgi:hypothetical protein
MITDTRAFENSIKIGETRECVYWDFKAELNYHNESCNIAKDIAAFANKFGGNLIFGIKEIPTPQGRVAGKIVGISDPEQIHKSIESIKSRYLPKDLDLRCDTIKISDVFIVSVSIYPKRSVCAVKINDTYIFPIRTDFGNDYLKYEDVEKMFDQETRRIYLKFLEFNNFEKEVYLNPRITMVDGRPCNDRTRATMIPGNTEIFELLIGANDLQRIPYSLVSEIWNSSNAGERIQIRLKSRLIQNYNFQNNAEKYVFE